MSYIILIVILVLVYLLFFGKKKNEENTAKNDDTDEQNFKTIERVGNVSISIDDEARHHIDEEAQKIIDKTNTFSALEKLNDRLESAEEKMSEIDPEEQPERYAKAYVKYKILEDAYCDAAQKPFKYYFDDDELDIYIPASFLKYIGKPISPQDYILICNKYQLENSFEEVPLEDAEDIEQIKEDAKSAVTNNIKEVMALRKIFESELDVQQKEKKFDYFVENSEYLKEWFVADSNYFQEYIKTIELMEKVEKLGALPHAKILVNGGYETVESIVNASDEELLSINGIGQVRLSEIRNYLKSQY